MEASCSGTPPDSSDEASQMTATGGSTAAPIATGTNGSGPVWHKPQQCWEAWWEWSAERDSACAQVTAHRISSTKIRRRTAANRFSDANFPKSSQYNRI